MPAPFILIPNIVKKDLSFKSTMYLFNLSGRMIFKLFIGVVFLQFFEKQEVSALD